MPRFKITKSTWLTWLLILLMQHQQCHTSFAMKSTRSARGIKDLQAALNNQPVSSSELGHCDFDKVCDWIWDKSQNATFKLVKAPLHRQLAPTSDASANVDGLFLWLTGPSEGHIKSIELPHPGQKCALELALYQVGMEQGLISLVIETFNRTTSVVDERPGNNLARWEPIRFNLGGIGQDFSIILEVYAPFANSSIAVDNFRLVDCFPEMHPFVHGNCTAANLFRCSNGSCLNRNHVCDLVADCSDGEDETADCDKMPELAKCNFESGWCGWTNVKDRQSNWTLHQGPPSTERIGPYADHTYRNETGTYAYVDMTGKNIQYGGLGTLDSPIFNPTPPYHKDPLSPYFKSCKIRFFVYQTTYQVALGLYLVQLKPHQNHSDRIWWAYKDRAIKDSAWNSLVITLPDIPYKYYLQFEASKSYGSSGRIALDDVSLSPECFGIGVPPDVVGDFDYYKQKIPRDSVMPMKHADFDNETIININTCGQTGRFGPTPEQCLDQRNNSDVELLSSTSSDEGDMNLRAKGIQRWTAPSGGYYTIIAMGSRGGRGALSTGSSLGTLVRGVIELEKGQQIYFMVGQPGIDACPKSLGKKNDTCQQSGAFNNTSFDTFASVVRQVKNIELKDGGGGGGGATYIFTIKPNGEQRPLLIAGGGGGLGPTRFVDDGVQHAKGMLPQDRNPVNGASFKKNAGGGGGWLVGPSNETVASGMALTKGGIGGVGCGPNRHDHGDGGFGGGGGGCLSGGGGGGYAGGSTGHAQSGNGEGGYSYVSPDFLHISYMEKMNSGPGEAFIIPAITGCGCYYRCAVVDQHLSETRCLCPLGWHLGDDGKTCNKSSDSSLKWNTYFVIMIIVSVISVSAITGLCFTLYHRYQQNKALKRRRQAMFGNGTELTSLRVVSDSMMTEFNPNYEFAGNMHSFKDLPQIPRDNITLVKPLGQGAFGEVYQGIYKYRRMEEHPVAVKTLPSLSTTIAETDFMMEALIMSKFDHPNIVHFIGVSFDKHPRYIVLELLGGGDLKNFLREERPRPDRPTSLTMQSLIMCSFDVAKGCQYMEDARFIHRDIAARNCLLTCKGPGRVVKIADFGMARDIYRSDYYRKGGKAMLPIKWMPPESFLDGIFTTKTDVWAFGVLLWEIMSFGYMPYTGCANREVMSMVTNGGRLEKPAGCPDPIYGIMTRCWHPNPDERPNFSTIVERIGYCLQDPDVVNHPTPNFDLLPMCDREITIMRPDPETECINVHPELDGGYMQPRMNFRPSTYRIGQAPGIVYASLRHSSEERENRNNLRRDSSTDSPPREHFHKHSSGPDEHDLDDVCDNKEHDNEQLNIEDDSNANITSLPASPHHQSASNTDMNDTNNTTQDPKSQPAPGDGRNGNESTTTTDTDSLFMPSPGTPPDTSSSSPNTCTSSPNRNAHVDNGNDSLDNVNGVMKKNALKAALSLDPSALCRGSIPYEKIAFSPPKARMNNPGSDELRKESLSHELPREEECSC